MSTEFSIPLEHEIPDEWLASSVMRHASHPFSDEALSEKYKSWFDVGPVDMNLAAQDIKLKEAGEIPNIPVHMQSIVDNPHQLFINASRRLMGSAMFERSTISFNYRASSVGKGAMQVASRPHIDEYLEDVDGPEAQQLRLVGFACNALPPDLLQGALSRSSLEYGRLVSLHNLGKRFNREPIPISRLIIADPALLHVATRATEPVQVRKFMRWHLRA